MVKGNAGSDAHAFRVDAHIAIGRNPVHRTLLTGGDIHLAVVTESDAGSVHQIGEERLDVIVGIDLVD